MSTMGHGLSSYLLLFLVAALAHEPWRWAGYAVGRNLNPEDEIFKWVRSVSTALVSAMAARLVLFPAGSLAAIPLGVRGAACAIGLAVFVASGRVAWKGVCAGAAAILVGKLVTG